MIPDDFPLKRTRCRCEHIFDARLEIVAR